MRATVGLQDAIQSKVREEPEYVVVRAAHVLGKRRSLLPEPWSDSWRSMARCVCRQTSPMAPAVRSGGLRRPISMPIKSGDS